MTPDEQAADNAFLKEYSAGHTEGFVVLQHERYPATCKAPDGSHVALVFSTREAANEFVQIERFDAPTVVSMPLTELKARIAENKTIPALPITGIATWRKFAT